MKDKAIGALLLVAGILVFAAYVYMMIIAPTATLPLLGIKLWDLAVDIAIIAAVGVLCFIVGWIGYTLLTTPAPAPIEIPEISSTEVSEGGEERKEEGS